MSVIILPGYSLHNKEWAFKLREDLPSFQIEVHEWRHWNNPEKSFSVNQEIEKIINKIDGKKVNIIAKSVGTRVAMKLLSDHKEKVGKIVLCGIPTDGENKKTFEIYKKGLENIDQQKILIIQNKNDPFASFDDIKKFIGSINFKIRIIEKPRSDHEYPYPNEIMNFFE